MAAFENEFYLAQEIDGQVVPWQDGPCYSSAGMDRAADVMGDIVDSLIAQGIEVEQAINEYGPGQQEIAVRYRDALGAADQQLKFRDTVRGVAETQHGLIASFAPKPFADGVGSGAHIHFSLWSPDGTRNLLYAADAGDRLLSDIGRWFVAGVLLHLPALVALTCPSFNSYERLKPHSWASSTVSWGPDNREASVRVASVVPGPRGGVHQRGAQGVRPELQPVPRTRRAHRGGPRRRPAALEPPEPVLHDPASLSPAEQARHGIRPLPASLREALAAPPGRPGAVPGARRPARTVHHRGPDLGGGRPGAAHPGRGTPGPSARVLNAERGDRHGHRQTCGCVDLTQPLHPDIVMWPGAPAPVFEVVGTRRARRLLQPPGDLHGALRHPLRRAGPHGARAPRCSTRSTPATLIRPAVVIDISAAGAADAGLPC